MKITYTIALLFAINQITSGMLPQRPVPPVQIIRYQNRPVCQLCHKTFYNNSNLYRHMRTIHHQRMIRHAVRPNILLGQRPLPLLVAPAAQHVQVANEPTHVG